MSLSKNWQKRDTIIFGRPIKWSLEDCGGIKQFDVLPLGALKKIVKGNFIDPDGMQNSSPTAGEFLAFMDKHPKFVAHGYAVSPKRDDYRVSIEGVILEGKHTVKELEDFSDLCHGADEFKVRKNELRAWWD